MVSRFLGIQLVILLLLCLSFQRQRWTFGIELRPDQYEQLKELACPGRSIASLVRQARFLKKQS